MRIIAGKFGGRRISPPAKMPHTRPTTDIAKEGLFNILQNSFEIEGAKTLDLFGGTGSISYELASRGAANLTIVEKDPKMAAFIKQQLEQLNIPEATLVQSEVFQFMERCTDQFDFIFAGPPYALTAIDELPKKVFALNLLKPGGWFVLEHTPRNDYKNFEHYLKERNYGTTIFTIFEQ